MTQLRDSSTSFHFDAYAAGSTNNKHYYIHCEDCLTSAYVSLCNNTSIVWKFNNFVYTYTIALINV